MVLPSFLPYSDVLCILTTGCFAMCLPPSVRISDLATLKILQSRFVSSATCPFAKLVLFGLSLLRTGLQHNDRHTQLFVCNPIRSACLGTLSSMRTCLATLWLTTPASGLPVFLCEWDTGTSPNHLCYLDNFWPYSPFGCHAFQGPRHRCHVKLLPLLNMELGHI